ncbi:MAG: FecR domain-containing protein [Planctomycetes bacterium]|nr:FecR domain-containing protein [Planctomycetota bacterium]
MNGSTIWRARILAVRLTVVGLALLATLILQIPQKQGAWADDPTDRLTSKPSVAAPAPTVLKVGADIATEIGQRRRIALEGGVAAYVNETSRLRFAAKDELALDQGEIYVEVPSRETPFRIRAGGKVIASKQGRWSVHLSKNGPEVRVSAGKVQMNETFIAAGWQLDANAKAPVAMPRASHALAWLKDLMIAAESPLVPGSEFAGGDLVAKDPDGQEAKITLRKFHVDVVIEDGFASTTIDQTYFNNEQFQLEGTFYFPLPADASLSRLAMYVGGILMEGGMAERDYARNVYESIRYANRDPALLEWLDGTTFKMRVFPMEPRTEKRIILSYTQKLPTLYDRTTYRFPAGHNLKTVEKWSVECRVREGAESKWTSPSHQLKARKDGGDLLLEASAKNTKLDRDLVLQLTSPLARANDGTTPAIRFNKTKLDDAQYLMVRYRPELKLDAPPAAGKPRTWLFLFEASGDRDPLLGRTQIEIVRHLLAQLPPEDSFLVATANTRVKPQSAKPQAATTENIDAALEFLGSAHLIGALDVGHTLEHLSPYLGGDACLVHLGSGIAAMGEKRVDALVKKLPPGTTYVGVGVGRRWNRALMKAAAESTGGYYTQINPDEPIAWRAFDLFAALHTPRLHQIEVLAVDGQTSTADPQSGEEKSGRPNFLLMQQSLSQGEELCALTRAVGQAASLPKTIRIKGALNGKPVEQSFRIADVAGSADYLPRTWAKLEIDRLLAEDAVKHKAAIIALSKAMYVMTPFTSLLVLEHEDLYTQYKVDRGRKDHWAMYKTPAKIDVVYEPEPGQGDPRKWSGKPSAKEVITSLGFRAPVNVKVSRTANAFRNLVSDHDSEWSVGLSLNTPLGFRMKHSSMSPAQQLRSLAQYAPVGFGTSLDGASTHFLFPPALNLPPISAGPRSQSAKVGQVFIVGGRTQMDQLVPARDDLGQVDGEWRRFWHTQQMLGVSDPRRVNFNGASSNFSTEGFLNNLTMPGEVPAAGVRLAKFKALEPVERMLAITNLSSETVVSPNDISPKDRTFFDLLAYAPGMNTSAADIQAVVEAEAYPMASSRSGQIDAGAHELLAEAKLPGWHSLTIPGEANSPDLRIAFDGDGRYVYERTLPPGIQERVVCDAKTITHLYPQLYVGAKRDVSRFHRSTLAALVPWFLPPAEDLARGADVKLIADRTIAIVPHGEAKLRQLLTNPTRKQGAESSPTRKRGEESDDQNAAPKIEWLRLVLVFGNDNRLAERRLVRMPDDKIVLRQVLDPSGNLRVLDADGKELFSRKGKLSTTPDAPNMAADTKNLVVVSMPYRSPDYVRKALKIEKKNQQELHLAEAVPLFTAFVGAGNANEALNVFRQAIAAREQKQLGYYVLLASCGVNLDSQNADVLNEHQSEPLAQYLALHTSPVLRKHASQWAVVSGSWNEGFLQHLAQTHALFQTWDTERISKSDRARARQERQKALDYVRKNRESAYGWTMLRLMEDRAAAAFGGEEAKIDPEFHRELAEGFRLFEGQSTFGDAARYEVARCLFKAGELQEARKIFLEQYRQALRDGMLPAIDADFRLALLGRDGEKDAWSELMRETADKLIKDKKRPAVLALASQCWQLGDEPLANALLQSTLGGIDDAKERTGMKLAGLEFLWHTKQIAQADDLLQELLKDKKLAKAPGLWRLGVQFAEERDMPDRALECLEKALEAEFRHRPEVIDLKVVRQEYGKLLGHYEKLAEAMLTLKLRPSQDFLTNVVRAADRWRALDSESAGACNTVASILQRLGDRELAWDYLTTPVAHQPSESGPWADIAQNLARKNVLDLADRAYQAAFEAEPTNAQLLWDRASLLRRNPQPAYFQALAHSPSTRSFSAGRSQNRWMSHFA